MNIYVRPFKGNPIDPLFVPKNPGHLILGEDQHGAFVACQTKNVPELYFFLSPEDRVLAIDYGWNVESSASHLRILYREKIEGRESTVNLAREIWERADRPVALRVYRLGHPLDFRRQLLSQYPLSKDGRGISWCGERKKWLVQIAYMGTVEHLGYEVTENEAYQLYDQRLAELKKIYGCDPRIKQMPFNCIKS
jgi:hypothetical protein